MRTVFMMFLLILLTWTVAGAATVRITPFSSPGGGETATTIVTLLSSRLESRGIGVVTDGAADFTLSGTYTPIGSSFSIDTTLASTDGKIVGRPFVEGSGETFLQSVGTLAGKIAELVSSAPSPTRAAVTPPPPPVAPPLPPTPTHQPRPGETVQKLTRIEGVMVGIAPVATHPDGSRTFAIASPTRIDLYRKGESLTLLSSANVDRGSLLTIDSIDLDGDGSVELCATIMDQEILRSAVYDVRGGKLARRLHDLPWYFRAVDLPGGKKMLYGQEISSDEDYYGPVTELKLSGNSLVKGSPLPLPNGVNLHRFAFMPGIEGGTGIVAIDPDNYLRVYSPRGEELWKGSDRVGGSETYFLRDEQQMQQKAFDRWRKRFLEPRMLLSRSGELIVPRNEGMMVIGDSRSYSKNSLTALVWNGAALQQTSSTAESQAYLADWYVDPADDTIVTLEVVQREGLFRKGASAIGVRRLR